MADERSPEGATTNASARPTGHPYHIRYGAPVKPERPDDPMGPGGGDPRGSILRLGQKLTDRIGHQVSTKDPEYWGLSAFVTDDMARIANRMPKRRPMTLDQISKATGKPKADSPAKASE